MNVCGSGAINVDEGNSKAWERSSAASTKSATERWQSALLASKNVRAQAAGFVLQAAMVTNEAFGAIDEDSCKDQDEACKQRFASARVDVLSRGAPESIGPLAQLATATLDPAVYAIAANACKIYDDAPMRGACDLISVDQWTRIDADNAAPWLMLAVQAKQRKDPAAEREAYERAAQAHRLDRYGDSLYAFSQPALPDDISPMDRIALTLTMTGVEARQQQPQSGVTQFCKASNLAADSKRREVCNSLAELYVAKARTLIDFVIGVALGKQVGWSQEKLAALTQERDALQGALGNLSKEIFETSNPAEFFGCAMAQRRNDYFTQLASLGELGLARDAIKKAGTSVPSQSVP